MSIRARNRSSQQMGKGCGTLFFGVFLLAGLFFTLMMGGFVWKDIRPNFWKVTPCTILTSSVEPKGNDYLLNVSYHYTFAGQDYTGTRLRASGNEYDDSIDAQHASQRYRSDRQTTCYVNASNPQESVLETRSLFFAFTLLFPLLFVTIGAGGIYAMWRTPREGRGAISDRHRKTASAAIPLRIIGAVFIIIGSSLAYVFMIRPTLAIREAASWQETPCTITSSKVEASRGNKNGTTYSIEIHYEYFVDGEKILGDRYNFDTGSSSGHDWRRKIVQDHPPGHQTVCYVNPADPYESVLVRDTSMSRWWGLIPLFFALIGCTLWTAGRNAARTGNAVPLSPAPDPAAPLRGVIGDVNTPTKLKPSSSPLGAFIGLLIFSLIWNGIVFGIMFSADLPTPAKVFLGLFALIGLGIFAAAVHQFLALFNPRPTLETNRSSVRLGQELQIRFSFTGRVQRIQKLTIHLRGREEATYRRGTDTSTDKSIFAEQLLLETGSTAQMHSGNVVAQIPANTVHSFSAPNNKIIWTLHLHGAIPRWPDVDLEFPFTVLPLEPVPREDAAP
jgi:hypothetical protein